MNRWQHFTDTMECHRTRSQPVKHWYHNGLELTNLGWMHNIFEGSTMSKRSRLDDVSGNFLEVGVKDEIEDDSRDDDQDHVNEDFILGIEGPSIQNGPTSNPGCCINLWTSEATKCLITLYKKYIDEVGRPPMKSMKDMFEVISRDLQALGHDYTTQKAENKWRVLLRKYKRHEATMESVTGRIPIKSRRSMYFEHKEELDDIFGPIARNAKVPTTGVDAETMENLESVTQTEDDGALDDQADDRSTGNLNAKTLENVVDRLSSRLGSYFDQMEKNNERRHQEITAIRLNELEIQREMLEVRKGELELRRQQMNLGGEGKGKTRGGSILSRSSLS